MPRPDPNPNPNSNPDPNPKAPEILLVNPASARYVGGHFNRGGKVGLGVGLRIGLGG